MNKKQKNQLRMFKAVLQVLKNYVTVWTHNLGFKELSHDFEAGINNIEETHALSSTSTDGIIDDKAVMHDELIDTIMEISGPFAAMASRSGNQELKSKVSFTDTGLDGMTEETLVKTGRELVKLAAQHTENLAKYDVTVEEVTVLEKLANAYNVKIAEPRGVVAERMAARKSLVQLIRETSQLLRDEMDGMVDKYRRTNSDFRNAYFNARKIVDYGTRHEKDDEADNGEVKS